ncbi:MAG: DegT/DnrJ/EryC1/StrS family aminotransferase [Actinomycetia bacterium]|nr:DegT/DnrJ/EryC1/StrS family aminotransferase [Actinomycetes bacterium]
MISYGRQSIDDDDIAAVTAVMKGDWLTQGPAIEAFEQGIIRDTGARHAIAFANGTATLHGCTVAAGLGPEDVLATSPLTFMASANCGRYVGASIDLIDIDPATLNLDPTKIGSDVDALVAVHYAGLPVDLRALNRRPRVVIEDAAHALGAMTPDGPVGNCAHSDMCSFSFHPVKPVTTGEGGVVTTNSDELAERLRRFRSHGIVRQPELGGWYYDIADLGFNYRLTDMQAALGLSQLNRLHRFIDRRNAIADRYRLLLADLPVTLPPAAPEGFRHGYHLFAIQVPDRPRVFAALRDAGIFVQVHYVPVYAHTISADIGKSAADYPNCAGVYEGLISMPVYPDLTDDEQDYVVATLRAAL